MSESETNSVTKPGWWVYLLECADGRTYGGVSMDVERRFQAHLAGKGAKFTRANRPVRILGVEAHDSKPAALRAEVALKKLGRTQRLQWAATRPWPTLE